MAEPIGRAAGNAVDAVKGVFGKGYKGNKAALMRQAATIANMIAMWYWRSRKVLSDAGKAGDVLAATKKINGGTIGLTDRKGKFDKYLAENTAPGFAAATVAANQMPAQAAAPSAASPAATAVPAAPSLPPVAQAPIPMPMNSKAPMEVTIADDRLLSQDLRDRRLAMIATGGLGG